MYICVCVINFESLIYYLFFTLIIPCEDVISNSSTCVWLGTRTGAGGTATLA